MANFVIYDTEFTAWEGSQARNWSQPWEDKELIQIGAVKVHISEAGCVVLDSFQTYIKPLINPQLSDYIVSLTGITQTTVDSHGAHPFDAVTRFAQFCELGACVTLSWGVDVAILKHNARINQFSLPEGLHKHINLAPILRKINEFDFSGCGGDLHSKVGIAVPGHSHNAEHDVLSIAVTLDFLIKNKLLSPESITQHHSAVPSRMAL